MQVGDIMTIDYKLIGKRIQERRQKKGTTQEDFAEHMDVTVGYISQLERGVTKVNLERLASIANYLECSISDLLQGVSKTENDYLLNEFNTLYQKLNPKERTVLYRLIEYYLEIKD